MLLLLVNEQRQHLILYCWKNGTISTEEANRYYSGNSGKDALISMESRGYFRRIAPGVFKLDESRLTDLPQELVSKIKRYEDVTDSSVGKYDKEESKAVQVPE